jgi:hypothetical protein
MVIRIIIFVIVFIGLLLPIFKLVKFIVRKINCSLNTEANIDSLNELKDKKTELINDITQKENTIEKELKELKNIKKEI